MLPRCFLVVTNVCCCRSVMPVDDDSLKICVCASNLSCRRSGALVTSCYRRCIYGIGAHESCSSLLHQLPAYVSTKMYTEDPQGSPMGAWKKGRFGGLRNLHAHSFLVNNSVRINCSFQRSTCRQLITCRDMSTKPLLMPRRRRHDLNKLSRLQTLEFASR